MTFEEVEAEAHSEALDVLGTVHENLPDGIATLVLLGPREPGFWPVFTASPEYSGGHPDPLDRWSVRVIGGLAKHLNASAYYPFGGPPFEPFIGWAIASGRAHVSPVGLLVHDRAGLMVSFRGALGFTEQLDCPPAPPNPCLACNDTPCVTACPVDALKRDGYDVKACKTDLERNGNTCMARGCAVRRACPVSQTYGRVEDQSAFHMRAFK